MRKQIFNFVLLLCVVTGLSSCGSGALKYNDSIVKVMNSFQPTALAFFEKIGTVKDGDFSVLVDEAKKMKALCESKLKDLSAIEEFKGGEKLKGAVKGEIEYVNKYADYVQKLGNKDMSETDRTTLEKAFYDFSQSGASLDKELEDAQAAFAKEHNFRIDPNKVVQ